MALLEGKILSQHFDQQEHCFFVAHQEGNCEYMYFLHFFFGMTPINTNYLVKQSHDATETLQVAPGHMSIQHMARSAVNSLLSPKSIILDKLNESSGALETGPINLKLDGSEILEGHVHNLNELERIDEGMAPSGFRNDIQQLGIGSGTGNWNIQALLASRGVSDIN